jgi:parvulin-like peptidyl-prolyl isomerase
VPTFDEAKKAIEPKVLRAAKADAFKAKVEAIAAKGVKEILASGKVSTNLTFTVADLKDRVFPDQTAITRAAMKLKKGEVSEFVLPSPGNALLVVCEDRKEGDAAKVIAIRSNVREDVTMLQRRQLPEAWRKWNLNRLGFVPGELSYVEEQAVEE